MEAPTKRTKKPTPTQQSLQEGFTYIRDHGPMANNQNQMTEWTASLSCYPITLRDMKLWVLDEIVAPFLGCATEFGLILQGQTGIGKTPLARALATALSQYHIEDDAKDMEPSIRSCSCLDMPRTEPGAKYKPVVYDDGPLDTNRPADLKAFLDVQEEEEALLWARWSSVKLVKAQHRCIVTNPPGEKPDVPGLARVISHKAFVNLISPAFVANMPEQDWMAISKRAFHVVFLRDRAFIGPPSECKKDVKQVWYPEGIADLLVDSCKPTLAAYKRREQPDEALLERNRRWSSLLVRKVMAGEKVDTYIAENIDAPVSIHCPSSVVDGNMDEAAPSVVRRDPMVVDNPSRTGEPSSGSGSNNAKEAITQPAKRMRSSNTAWSSQLRPSQAESVPIEIDLSPASPLEEPTPGHDAHDLEELMAAALDEEDSDVVADESD